jgi:hypothetical protein
MGCVQHRSFLVPRDHDIAWRYLSLTKFLHMLETGTLWFARGDLLGDSHEGSLTRPTAQAYARSRDEFLKSLPPAWPKELIDAHGQQPSMAEQWRMFCHVSSWHLNPHEASWMWKSYIPESQGIALRSDFRSMRMALQSTDRPVHVGLVRYLDYETEAIDIDNAFVPVLTKRREFEGERELRMVVLSVSEPTDQAHSTSITLRPGQPPVDENGEEFTSLPLTFVEGVPVAVNLAELIHEIRLAPGAGAWAVDAVKRAIGRYGLTCLVRASSIDDAPQF